MPTFPINGSKIYIGTPLDRKSTPWTEADFASITWTEIKGWTTLGAIGPSAQLISTQLINSEDEDKQKGSRNWGSMQNTFAADPTDAGQIALIAAEATRYNYAFKVEWNDKPATGASPKNSLRYFIGLVMMAQEAGGGANAVQTLNATVEINSKPVRVNASAT